MLWLFSLRNASQRFQRLLSSLLRLDLEPQAQTFVRARGFASRRLLGEESLDRDAESIREPVQRRPIGLVKFSHVISKTLDRRCMFRDHKLTKINELG
ncbi:MULTISPECIES: hypothetical protein [Methylobacterium]|uniref:hypothetical protein n=1 Tax=Methylobacterium TaxID=407 RepID=UPI00130E22C3|nr:MULTISPECIES: hypothetical protein [Methylobacterium]